jgi:hypothetical protein
MYKVAPSSISINPLYVSDEQLIKATLVGLASIAMNALEAQSRLHAVEEQRMPTRRKEQSEALDFQVNLFSETRK